MNQLHFYYNIVEKAIAKLGIDPQTARSQKPGHWSLHKGHLPVWIDVYYLENEKRSYFQVACPLMKMPTTGKGNLALELLATNNQLFGVAFCMHNEQIFLKTLRETDGLDIDEAEAMILRIANYGDNYDQQLRQKYPEWMPAQLKSTPINPN